MKALYKILSLVVFAGLFASCNEDPTYYTPLGQGQEDNLHIKCDNNALHLVKADESLDAITFSWDKVVSSLSPDGDVTYSIRIFNADNVTETTKFYNVGTDTQKTFTVYELNSIIGRWVPAGTICNLTAQVVAKMANNAHYVLPQKSSCSFTAIGYERFPAKLYMHILDQDMAELDVMSLSQTSLGSGIYMLNDTYLDECYYYFGTTDATSETAGPSYSLDKERTLSNGKGLALNMNEVQLEDCIEFTSDDVEKYAMAAPMTIIVDLNDPEGDTPGLDVRYANIFTIPSGSLYIAGDACEIGWNAGVSQAQFTNPDPRCPWVYTWTGNFEYKDGQENSFKLLTSTSFDQNAFFAATAWADPAKDHTLLPMRNQGEGGDIKWKIAEDVKGLYTVTVSLDLNDMWIKLEKADEATEE